MQNSRDEMPPKISVIIPSYNKVKFIGQTLKSVFDQKYPDLEVIIQDGGSTDGTANIIKKFTKRYSIIYESKKDNGQLEAINTGLKKATGEILTFINADDCYEKEAFSLISKEYQSHPDALWFAGRGTIINEKNVEIVKPVTWYKNMLLDFNSYFLLLVTNYLIQPSIFITRSAFEKFGPFTGTSSFIMEYDMWLKIGRNSMPVVINKNLSRFRIEPGTKTKTLVKNLLLEDWKIVNKYTNNRLVLLLHRLNNLGRIMVDRFV